jgi:hypothetical protein
MEVLHDSGYAMCSIKGAGTDHGIARFDSAERGVLLELRFTRPRKDSVSVVIVTEPYSESSAPPTDSQAARGVVTALAAICGSYCQDPLEGMRPILTPPKRP